MSKLFDAVDGAENALTFVRQAKAIAGLRGDAFREDCEDADIFGALVNLLHNAQVYLEAVQKIGVKDDAPETVIRNTTKQGA